MTRLPLPLLLVLPTLVTAVPAWAETRYVTDQFEITMRSGASTSNNILSMLKSGQSVQLIEEDDESKYSLVETSSGKQGYVLTRFLIDEPSGRAQLARVRERNSMQQAMIDDLSSQLEQYRAGKNHDDSLIQTLQQKLNETQAELDSLQESTRDTVQILRQNEDLRLRINELSEDIQQLTAENTRYKDKTAMDWFIRGASVSLIAFLLGILVTRIRWRKRDSWGSY